jgi:hypothetical protein
MVYFHFQKNYPHLNSVLFTYCDQSVDDSFIDHLEAIIAKSKPTKYSQLIICSETDIPGKLLNKIRRVLPVIRILPNALSKKIIANSNGTFVINPLLLTAFSQPCSNITIFDPATFVISQIDPAPVLFYKTHAAKISSQLFRIEQSSSLYFAATQFFSNLDFSKTDILNSFSYFIINSLALSKKVLVDSTRVFADSNQTDPILIDKLVAVHTSSISPTQLREVHKIKSANISARRSNSLMKILSKFYSYIDATKSFTFSNTKSESNPAVSIVRDSPIKIVYTKFVENYARELSITLASLDIQSELSAQPDTASDVLHIILCPIAFTKFPKNYIAYQCEQANSAYFTEQYLQVLNNAIEIWDYSNYNIETLGKFFDRPYILMPPSSITLPAGVQAESGYRPIDVLFYGSINPRRRTLIRDLRSAGLNVISETDLFGEELLRKLSQSKIVINHHFYESGQLETIRVYESLSAGCSVISETSIDQDQYDLPIDYYSTSTEAISLVKAALDKFSPSTFKFSNFTYLQNRLIGKKSEIKVESPVRAKKTKAVYTCISGKYDSLKPLSEVDEDWDYICFTDQAITPQANWQIRPIPESLDLLDPIRKARAIKVLPHIFLQEYSETLWLDGSIQLINTPTAFVSDILSSDDLFAVCKHPDRTCVYAEADACVFYKKDDPSILANQVNQYRSEQYPENWGMVQTGILYRKNQDSVNQLCEAWWSEIATHSVRDQMSFNYCLWKNPIPIKIMNPKIMSSNYFQLWTHASSFAPAPAKLRKNYGDMQNYINGESI